MTSHETSGGITITPGLSVAVIDRGVLAGAHRRLLAAVRFNH